jgi:hypothetical protein
MMCVHIPLRPANVGREKLVLPFLIPLLIFLIDHFPHLAAGGHRSCATVDYVQGNKQEEQANGFDYSHDWAPCLGGH